MSLEFFNADTILLWILTLILSTVAIILLAILSARIYNTVSDKKAEKLKFSYQRHLVIYLTEEGESSKRSSDKIQRLAKSSVKKKNLLLDALLDLNHNFSGEYSTKVNELYYTLALHKISYRKLQNPFWFRKIKGIYELSSMKYSEAYDRILPLTNHRNPNVRRAARVATVKLNQKQGLIDLKDTPGQISKWTQICIISILKREPVKLSDAEILLLKKGSNKYINELGNELEQLNHADRHRIL